MAKSRGGRMVGQAIRTAGLGYIILKMEYFVYTIIAHIYVVGKPNGRLYDVEYNGRRCTYAEIVQNIYT